MKFIYYIPYKYISSMLYSRDGIIKDNSLITIERDGKIIHNPSKSLLESEGWVEYTGQFSQFTNKRFIKMTSDVLENFDKGELVDTIVFLTDNNKLYLNGQYFGGEDIVVSYDEYGSNNTYVGEVNINGNSFEIGVPYVHYNDYTGGTNIGQLVVGDDSYDVYAPQTSVNYQDLQGGGKKLGILNINEEEYPIYMPLIEEAPKLSQKVTIEELNNLKKEGKLNPGQKYVVTDYRTNVNENIGEVVYQENEKHELIFTALSKSELDNDVTSIQTFKSSSETIGGFEPTSDFELIAYKCDWNYETEEYEFDTTEVYKYKGDTIDIDGVTHYIWTKYENGIPVLGWQGQWRGKCRVVTSSLDFECSLENPYHPDYYINYDDTINNQYFFEEPGPDDGEKKLTDSFGRVERIDHPVYNYKVIADVCDWDHVNEVYGYDDSSWYVYCGDTIDIDGVTYFIWYKTDLDTINTSCCFPLTNTLYLDCNVENPYTPELWMTKDGELNNEYFNPTNTDIFCGIKESNLPSLVQEIEVVDREPVITKVQADLDIIKSFDESQVVNAVAFKTLADKNNNNYDKYLASYTDYESFHLYTGDTFEVDGQSCYVWDKWFATEEGVVNGDYAIDEYGLYPQKLLTDKLHIDCSINNPYTANYSLHSEDEVLENYQLSHFGDSFVEIHYFNNVTNYIRFEHNGWYVRCPELDRDGKFGWGYIDCTVNSQDGNSYNWGCEGEGNSFGPIPCFLNNYNLSDDDYFLTDTENPQVGDSFYRNDGEDDLDTIDKVWGTEIYPTVEYKGITYMKDEFGNEAPYDFKHIQFEGLYTFGNETEDYSLDGFENNVYNNKIMKPIDKQYNRVNFSERNTYGNTIYPSVTDCVIDFEVKESLITKSELGLHVFDPTSFITPISVKPLVSRNQIIAYKTIDEQIVEPKSDAFGDANIISNTYE